MERTWLGTMDRIWLMTLIAWYLMWPTSIFQWPMILACLARASAKLLLVYKSLFLLWKCGFNEAFALVNGQGSEPIENTVEYEIISSNKPEEPQDFPGIGTLHIHLVPAPGALEKYLRIKLSAQIVLSALKFELVAGKSFKAFSLQVSKRAFQYPNEYTDLGV